MKLLAKMLTAAAWLGLASQAFAQGYPARPIRMVLTYSGGISEANFRYRLKKFGVPAVRNR